MVTTNPATALGCESDLGRIAPGFLADLIAIPLNGPGEIYEQIVTFPGQVPWMMVGGAVV